MTLSNIWFADSAGRMIPASPSYGPVTKWKRLTFTPAELQNPAISGDRADPDGDGLPNLVEMLLRGRAKAGDRDKVPGFELTVDAASNTPLELALKYRVSRTLLGVEPEVRASANLLTWPTVVPSLPTGVQDATTIEMRASVRVEGQGKMFLRLEAKRRATP